jgi:hypothetical protein
MDSEKIRAGGGDAYVALHVVGHHHFDLIALDRAVGGLDVFHHDPHAVTRLRLKGGIIAVVDDNPRDGMWIVVKYVETPDGPVESDQVEMVMTDDVLGLA